MSDRIAVMRDGRFEQVGQRTEVYRRPATAFVAGFVGQSNRFHGVAKEAGGASVVIDWQGHALAVPGVGGVVAGDQLLFCIKYEDVEVSSVRAAPGAASGHNRLAGKLRDIIFKGQTANYLVTLDNGVEIVASGASGSMQLHPGDKVIAHWPPAHGASFKS